MSGFLTLNIPESKQFSAIKRIHYSWVLASILCILLLVGLTWWFIANRNVSSVLAHIDGNVYSVNSQFAGIVEAITVSQGDNIVAGQPVGRIVSVNTMHTDLSKKDLSSFRPPDLAEMEARIKQAEEAEKNIVLRIGKARKEEDSKKKNFEQAANEHAKAQYQRRSLDNQGGAHVLGQLQAAQKIENDSYANMEKSREEFELASRTRAVQEQELGRIRDEINRAKQIVSKNRYVSLGNPVPTNTIQSAETVSTIYATTSGKVVSCNVRSGQNVNQGDSLILVAPDTTLSEKQPLWVLAYFPMRDADKIKRGQSCEITFEQDDLKAQGKVDQIDTPRQLPIDEKNQINNDLSNYLPVRIKIEGASNQTPVIGSSAKCTIKLGLI